MADPNTTFTPNPELTAISVAYKNPDVALIADAVLPRVPVGSTLFEHLVFDDAHKAFTVPPTMVGPRGKVNRLDLQAQRVQKSTEDVGLDLPLSYYDVSNPAPGMNPRGMATELLTSLVQLDREVRAANLVFNADSYAADNVATLTGADQLDNAGYVGKPLKLINDGLRAMLMRGNVLVFGTRAWDTFRMLPAVVKAVLGNAGDSGMATRLQVAALFEVQEVIVGEGFVNIAKPGETPQMVRVWDNHCAALYRNRTAGTVGGMTFGYTAQYGSRVAGSIQDVDVGLRGGERVRVGESVREVIAAPSAGFFWEDLVSAA